MPTKPTLILIVIAVIFGGVYFWLATPLEVDVDISPRFDWPDEVANYFWVKQYAQTGELAIFEPLNLVAKNQIHPRSFNVRSDGSLVPGSFLGLILFYGTLAKIFGVKAIIYFTPVLALLGVLAFFGISKIIFNEKIALLSAILMLIHPAWWYYSITSMLPNVVFVSLLLLGIYFLLRGTGKLRLWQIVASAFFTGLAVSIRPTEIVWVGVVYLIIIIYLRERLKITRLVLFLGLAFLMVLPSIYEQQILYGDFFSSGYSQLYQDQSVVCQACQIVKSLILPFGFNPRLMVYNFWNHYLARLWWLSLLIILGLVAYFTQSGRQKIEVFGYTLLSLFLFTWLVVYYGSWQFDDLLTVNLNTLGLSYVRYWLPLYVLALPFIAISLLWLTSFFKNRWQNIAIIILILALFYQSADLVLRKKPDSILPVRTRIAGYKEIAAEVIKLTGPDSVIVTVRKDKLFFPDRRVIHTFQALSLNSELADTLLNLVEVAPTYYYALGPEPTLELENGLKLKFVKNIGQEILYKIQ